MEWREKERKERERGEDREGEKRYSLGAQVLGRIHIL
jgi:hypothetical protein